MLAIDLCKSNRGESVVGKLQDQTLRYRTREIQIREDGNKVSFTASSETPVETYFPAYGMMPEVLLHDADAVTIPENISLLFEHDRRSIIGPVESIEIDRGERVTRAIASFDDTEDGERAKKRVRSRSLRGVSVGYTVEDYLFIDEGESFRNFSGPMLIARKWMIREVSLTPVPADQSVGVGRSVESYQGSPNIRRLSEMEEEEKGGNAPSLTVEKRSADEVSEILLLCELVGMDLSTANGFIASERSLGDIRRELVAHRKGSPKPAAGGGVSRERGFGGMATITGDGDEKLFNGFVDAQLLKGGIKLPTKTENDRARHFYDLTIQDMARKILERRNIDVPSGGTRILERAAEINGPRVAFHGEIDYSRQRADYLGYSADHLPIITGAVVNKAMAVGYNDAPTTYQNWVRIVSVPDFKDRTVVQMSEVPDPELIGDGAEIPQATTLGDSSESYNAKTYAQMIAINRKTLVNDDLGILSRLANAQGSAARRFINKTIYDVLNSGTAATYNMNDGNPLFDASNHSNYGTTGTALAASTLNAGFSAVTVQTGPNNQLLGVKPRFLIVPPMLFLTASELVYSTAIPQADLSSGVANPFRGMLELIVEALVQAGTNGSQTAWYLAADHGQIDTVEVAFLGGLDAPQLKQEEQFHNLATKFRLVVDFGTKAIDWRGLYKATGASE
jgi:HK97 family phage prohead protease